MATKTDTGRDELAYKVDSAVMRLQKIALRPSVRKDPVAEDNIRLATRTLRSLVEPAPAYTEPIDILCVE
jgi:hypothetical protein